MEMITAALSVILFVLFLRRPIIGLYLLVFFLPFIGFDLPLFGLDIPPVDLVALILVVAFVTQRVFSFIKNEKQANLRWPILIPFVFFLSASFISSLFATNPMYSLWYFVRWPLFLYFAYIFLPYNLIKDQKVLKRTIVTLALSSLLVLFFGFLSLMGQDWRDNFFRIKSLAIFGLYPYGENHNLIAEFLNVGTFLLLSLRFLAKDWRFKRLFDVLFVISAFGVIMTFSRSGWIILALQAALYAWLYLRDENFRKKDLSVLLIVAILVLSPLFVKMMTLQESNTSSTENRVLLSEISIEAFSQKPALGYGSGAFINLVESNVRFRAKYGEPIDSHGVLQKVAAENGLFGLLSWIFLGLYLLILFIRALKKYGIKYPWLAPLLIASLGGLFFQIFNTSYYKGKVWLPITLSILAIELVEKHYEKNRKQK